MRPVSDRYLAAVTGSHGVDVRATLVTPAQTGVTPAGTVVALLDGSVTVDGTADIRSTADVTIHASWPRGVDGPAPYGRVELFLERAVVFGDGAREWVSLGYFRLRESSQDDAPDGPIRLTVEDRMSGIVEARLTSPRQFSAALTYEQVVADLVEEVYPAALIEWDDDARFDPLGRAVIAEDDRHGLLNDLVTSLGKVWYFDHRGALVIRDPPPVGSPVVDVAAGPGGVLVSAARTLSRDGVYNAVVASGEAADDMAPPRAVATDDDPVSVTFWDGPYGKVPRFFSSPFITTVAQARSAAASLLARSTGLPSEVDFTMVPNIALEPLDTVRVVYPIERGRVPARLSELHELTQVTVPLGSSGAMTCATRRREVVT